MFNIRNIQIIEQVNGIEPSFPGWKPGALTIVLYLQTLGVYFPIYIQLFILARVKGFEPLPRDLESLMLPLHHTRVFIKNWSLLLLFKPFLGG